MPHTRAARRAWENGHLATAASTLEAYKLERGCLDCGYCAHPAALHFDHRDPSTKRADLGWVNDRSKLFSPRRLSQFLTHVETYCDVRCANCHAVRTATEGHYTVGRPTRPAEPLPSLF